MFGDTDYPLPNPHGSSQQYSRLIPAPFSPPNHWRYYSLEYLLNIMPNNDSTLLNSNLSNSSSDLQDNLSTTEEAPDHLLYIIIPLYSLVFVIGTLGNMLVILTVVTVKQMRNTTNALILHLAIANISFVLMCIPHTIYFYVAHSYGLPRLLCKVANTLMYLSAYVSIYILVLMSVDRFLGVVFAVKSTRYRTERNVHLAVIFVWLIGIIFSSPNMLFYDVLFNPPGGIWVCLFREDSESLNIARRVTAYFFAIFGLIVPLIIIGILYGLIINVLRKNSKGKQVAKGKKRVTKMVSAVISSFIICWTPMQIYLLLTHYNQVSYIFAILAQCLVYISSCVNPILYAFLSEPFRKAFQQFLTCSKLLSNHFANVNDPDHVGGGTAGAAKKNSYRAIKQEQQTIQKKSAVTKGIDSERIKTETGITIAPVSEPIKYDRLANIKTTNQH